MKSFIFLLFLTSIAVNGLGQKPLHDKEFKEPPPLGLENLDSVEFIKIFKASQGGMSRDPLNWEGFLEIEITLNDAQQMVAWKRFNDDGSKVVKGYRFTYTGEENVLVEEVEGRSYKKHTWLLRDTLIQEIKLLKGKKQKHVAVWKYTYMQDTLISKIVKFDKNMEVVYQIEYDYSDSYELIGQTVIEKGQPRGSSEATYDSDGKLTGYTWIDLKKDTEDQHVEIERDSSSQVSTVNYLNQKGSKESWHNTYNEKGLVQSSTKRNAEGQNLARIDYSYDGNDKLIQRSHSTNDVLKVRYEWKYDERGNILSKHSYKKVLGNLGLIEYLIFTYDDANRLIRKDYWNKMYGTRTRLDYRYMFF